ncbi:MAG: TerB family tellurite resistance protein [Deltaproteobacteria bacterium]|nr:TerB family tellurite resistance protein [Deltaproteobacteria bacterium]
MLNMIRRLFSPAEKGSQTEESGVDDVRVAACALLIEVASIDGEFSDHEREAIIAALRNGLCVPEDEVKAVLEIARKELEGSIDLWQFTHLVNRHSTIAEKEGILELVWQVVLSDLRIDKHEDYLVRKLAELLRLDHRQMIEAKLRAREQLQQRS